MDASLRWHDGLEGGASAGTSTAQADQILRDESQEARGEAGQEDTVGVAEQAVFLAGEDQAVLVDVSRHGAVDAVVAVKLLRQPLDIILLVEIGERPEEEQVQGR